MTNEQREAIEELKSLSPSEGAIEMILSLIKEQQIYIKKYNDTTEEMNRDIRKLISEIEKKDKQIDLMAEHIHRTGEYECPDIKCGDNEITCKDCIKQYFERKVEEC